MDGAKRKVSPTKGRRAKKVKKQNDGIKKPTSAYLYFVSDYRMVLKKKGENISRVQEVAKLCGEAWKSMNDEEKIPYSKKYAEDRARYLKEKEAYDRKMGKDPNKPKRPQTAYFFFLADFRKEMAGKPPNPEGKKIPTLAGERWKTMTAEQKKTYELMVEKDKIRYEKDMTEWRKTHPELPKKPVSRKKVPIPEPVVSSDDDDSDDSEEEEEESEDDSD